MKTDLQDNRKVLFSGTSCQISALKSYLNIDDDNLLCIDIVCHGVPSPKIWSDYVKWQENRYVAKCIKADFRNKQKYGWDSHMETLTMKKKSEQFQIDSNIFTTLFYAHNIIRPSCYKCPYKSISHPSDITIADYWGIDKACSGFDDNKGVSLVLINSEKGNQYFNKSKYEIVYETCLIENSMQEPLIKPFSEPEEREIFWENYRKNSFHKIIKKYTYYSYNKRLVRKIKSIFDRVGVRIK